MGLSLLGQLGVIYVPPLQAIFQTEALSLWVKSFHVFICSFSPQDLVRIVALTSSVFIVDEVRKSMRRRKAPAASVAEFV